VQPFDKHTANAGELESCGADLLAAVGESITNGDLTRQAYAPAVANWSGVCAPEIAAAHSAFTAGAESSRAALAWAAVTIRYWAAQVRSFNQRVDEIVSALNSRAPSYGATGSNGQPPDAGAIASAKAAAEAAAKQDWWTAYNTYIVDGGNRAASMLQQGPTEQNISEAIRVGALNAPEGWNPLPGMWEALRGNAIPPFDSPLGLLGLGLFGLGRLGSFSGWGASWMDKVAYGVYVNGHWRGTPSGGRIWIDPYWRATPGDVAARARWATFGKWSGRAGAVLAVGTGALNQWMMDSGRSDLTTSERVGRTAWRGGIAGGATILGAKAGAAGGAAIGTLIFPGVGTVIGGVIGGVVGGAIGAGLGNKIADLTVDAAGWTAQKITDGATWTADKIGDGASWTADRIGDGAEWAGDRASDAKDWVGDRASDVGDALSGAASAVNPFD
jgi:hypothetical protein